MIRICIVVGLLAWGGAVSADADGNRGPFDLVDHTGRAVTDAAYRGSYVLLFFGYASCPDICPTDLAVMADAVDLLGPDGARVQPLFVSIDPERDTPERLAAYVPHFHPRLIGLTGNPEQVARAAATYRARYRRAGPADNDGGYLIDHTAAIYLLGPDGSGLALFHHGTPAADIASVIRRFMARDDRGGDAG